MNRTVRIAQRTLIMMLIGFYLVSSVSHANQANAKRFVVLLDSDSIDKIVESQEHAFGNVEGNTAESNHEVKLKEEFRTESQGYLLLEAPDETNISKYLDTLELSAISVIETEFTNSPEIGGGPKAMEVPQSGHNVFVIERGVPGISKLPMEKQIEISKGSQQVVGQFGGALEWDKSFLTQEGTFCVYRTDDEDHIKEHASLAGFPADKISAVQHTVYNY